MSRRRWLQVRFRASPPHQDILIGLLAHLGFSGFLQDGHSFSSFLEYSRWTPRFRSSFDNLLSRFRKEFRDADVLYSTTTINDRNWNERWEQSIGIVEVTKKIVISPSWRKVRKKDRGKIILKIDPKMSFGTGHHESTRLCLRLAEHHVKKGMRALDVGSGTGVLAIAAVKLGARSAVAVDNDPWATANARENVRKNRVEGAVRVLSGDMKRIPRITFDVILCNIDLPTLLDSMSTLIRKLRKNGILILSGLLTSDLPRFLDNLQNKGIIPLEMAQENEWAAAALVKSDAF